MMAKRLSILPVTAAIAAVQTGRNPLLYPFDPVNRGSGCGRRGAASLPAPCAFRAAPSALRRTGRLWEKSAASLTAPPWRSTRPRKISKVLSSADESPGEGESSPAAAHPLIVLIGGSGFLGSEIRRQLRERGAVFVATSTSAMDAENYGSSELIPLDLTAADGEKQFHQLVATSIENSNGAKKVAVISAMGAIGTKEDEEVNAALSRAIRGAQHANMVDGAEKSKGVVERFVLIGNTKRVRRLARSVPFLKGYASGKDEAESSLRECFGCHGCIIKPSFIYGGDDISLQPPRLPSNLGSLASEILGLYPIQALEDRLPDALAVPLTPPVSAEVVASAAINVALGIVEGYTEELEGEAIKMAGSVRGWKERMRYEDWLKEGAEEIGIIDSFPGKEACDFDAVTETNEERRWRRIGALKDELLHGDMPSDDGDDTKDEIAIMEELECLRPSWMKPAYDSKLNGQWNFVLSKDDLGTKLIKKLLPPETNSFGKDEMNDEDSVKSSKASPPWRAILSSLYELKGLYMRIHDEQSQVEIVLSSCILFGRVPIDAVVSTSLLSTNYDEETEGTLFLEKFESIEVGGLSLPLPASWQRFRYLEITFLDDEILIARGSGGEPHVLVRENS